MKNKAKNITLALVKTIFKAGLIITGVSTFSMGWLDTPYGSAPIVQVFGVLNIFVALAWEYFNQQSATTKK